ncbi:MAG: DNA adenine methylase [Coleofasciculus sp. G3-WIS-01]|uniref:DNA adenine methylase n=1 Tax=Coleofasciculus sp. G3-WIS-01 TaxID=3069528 RepID=UPI0032F0D2FF
MDIQVNQRSDYTFKYNQKLARHGWLRLTPAYSVKLVSEMINKIPSESFILDPFSGTATTGLVAAEQGLQAHCLDINRFLIWLGNAKCRNYSFSELDDFNQRIKTTIHQCKFLINQECWTPEIYNITRWWSTHTLKILAALRQALVNEFGEPKEGDVSSLAWVAFCRLVIETSSAAFNHVSMSFHDQVIWYEIEQIEQLYQVIIEAIVNSISYPLAGKATVFYADSRYSISINDVKYSHVVTSPPYPNRMSYIRELRPYMYWTKFLDTAKEAGEIDWQAIGGTWGVATSRLQSWEFNGIELSGSLNRIVSQIGESENKNARLMAKYVEKYFYDMHLHFENLRQNLQDNAVLSYIVGNSSFYGIPVNTEKFLEESLKQLGYTNIGSQVIRKRNSKKELFEYCVSATWK